MGAAGGGGVGGVKGAEAMGERSFELKSEHITLLRRAYVRWEDCEFGAPAIDCKRPYGDSDVLDDMAEILGIEPMGTNAYDPDEPGFTRDQEDYLNQLHKETQTALQVILSTGSFEPGVYTTSDYGYEWRAR